MTTSISTHCRSSIRTKPRRRTGLTLVEMLVAIAITLVMMSAVASIFVNVSGSINNRRAVIELGGQMRHVRNVLQRDLAGATCPLLPPQRPESNHGYFEIIEGLYCDFYPSLLTDGQESNNNPELDHAASTVPASNVNFTTGNDLDGNSRAGWKTDGLALGDYDDILAFTTRNEQEPFSGRAPDGNVGSNNAQVGFASWGSTTIKSPIAEVVWYAIENPASDTNGYFGEAGYRTIYRRVLLVAPWLDYKYDGKSRVGVLRVLPNSVGQTEFAEALACLIAFQERYDISARLEFDPTIDLGAGGRWTIVANTLADLTKRENRYEHHGIVGNNSSHERRFPDVMMSAGGAAGNANVTFVNDPELPPPTTNASATLFTDGSSNAVAGFTGTPSGNGYTTRPLAMIEGGGTARAIINEAGQVVYVTTGLVPLGVTSSTTSRRGEDVMMTQALAFDVQVFDPQAPVYGLRANGSPLAAGDSELTDSSADVTPVTPGDRGWWAAVNSANPALLSSGAYVDLGFANLQTEVQQRLTGSGSLPAGSTPFSGLAHGKSLLQDARLTRVYDTWNFGYENDGVNQDANLFDPDETLIDEGTDGFDSPSFYDDNGNGVVDTGEYRTVLGVDDAGELETSPPYPHPLRAVQVKLRAYEPDSRQLREVTVRQHCVPE